MIMVTRPNARSIAVSLGEGLDLDTAKASGVMEAIEVHHAEHIRQPLRLASRNEMSASQPLLDLDRLPDVAGSRYHPNLPMLWIEGYDLLGKATLWLPYECSHANFTLPSPPGAGFFGASTGAAAALVAASRAPSPIGAVVSRGGRPDLAGPALATVKAPTLLVVGGFDREVLRLNEEALAQLRCEKALEIVPGATHLFEEPGTLDAVIELAEQWFTRHLGPPATA